jgi:hypothetical protein
MAEYARKKIVEANSGDKPLKTAAQRELDALRTSKVFTATAVKVQLPDRTVLQGVFSPLDSLAELHAWVRSHLSDRARALPYYLYSAPPPTQYRDEGAVTLGDAKLVPAKLLHFAFGAGLGARLPPGSLVCAATGAPVDGGSAAAVAPSAGAGAGAASGAASAAGFGSPAALPEGVVAVPSTAEELLHPDALAMAIAALTAATSGAAAGAGGEVASPSEGTGLAGSAMSLTSPPAGAGAAGAAGSATGCGAAGSGRAAAPAEDVNDADLERMAAALLSGDMSALQQRAPARPAAGGAGAGTAGAGAGGAAAKGKPSWLRI